jgi:hypothetical protein
VDVDRSALTTIRPRSIAGPVLAQFALMLVVCAGLVLLLPVPVSSDHDGSNDADTSLCAAPTDPSRGHQLTDGATVNDPDSCDDDDDGDDDGDDDDGPDGSSQALASAHRGDPHLDAAFHIVRIEADRRPYRPLDAHSLRGPPSLNQESNDADVDDDDDDDGSLRAHHPVFLAAVSSREPHLPLSVDSFRTASIGPGPALRAPPQ